MVKNATTLSHTGLRDWIIQRVSAIIIGVYALTIVGFIVSHSQLSFQIWHDFISNPLMRIFTVMVLLSILYHSWIGIWTVLTDYINSHALRLFLEVLMVILLMSYLIWGLMIIFL